jgi:nitrogen fixation protein NifU and related proteins
MSSLYSEQLLDHFRSPRHAGLLPPPAVTITAENPACGDLMKLSAEPREGVIARAGFQVRGCTASIAAGSALAEWLTGRPVAELRAAAVRPALEQLLGPLPEASRHVVTLCEDAIAALARAL